MTVTTRVPAAGLWLTAVGLMLALTGCDGRPPATEVVEDGWVEREAAGVVFTHPADWEVFEGDDTASSDALVEVVDGDRDVSVFAYPQMGRGLETLEGAFLQDVRHLDGELLARDADAVVDGADEVLLLRARFDYDDIGPAVLSKLLIAVDDGVVEVRAADPAGDCDDASEVERILASVRVAR